MASTINALTTGVGGVQTTGDTSGNISLQSNGSTVLAMTNTGVGVTGAMTVSNGLAVTGTLTVNGAAPGRSGASYATLSSGTPNITLTASSNQVQMITADGVGQSITLPNMTTLTTGAGYFVFYNTSIYPVALKDAGGTIREYLLPSQSISQNTLSPIQGATLVIEDISTSNGVWHCQNPTAVVTSNILNYVNSFITSPSGSILVQNIMWIGSNYFLVVASDNSTTLRVCLGTLNTSTKAMTFGSYTTLYTVGSNESLQMFSADSNGSDRGIITSASNTNLSGSASKWNAWGFAVVSGTLYVSSASAWTGVGVTGVGGNSNGIGCQYALSNNAFLLSSEYSASTTYGISIRGFTVGVTGTTVTLAAATGTYTTSNTSSDYYSISFTSATTMVMDRQLSTASPAYLSYNTSTNAITSGARTSQTSKIAGYLLPDILASSNIYFYNASMKWIFTTSGSKVLSLNYAAVVTNAGSATLTVAATTYSLKSFASKSYSTMSNNSLNITNVYLASASVGYAFDSANNLWYSFDPSNSNLNFNFGSANVGQFGSPTGGTTYNSVGGYFYWISSTQVVPLLTAAFNYSGYTANIYIDIQTFATPFIS